MVPLSFQGHSDDTFGEYGRSNQDSDNCATGRPIVFKVVCPDGAGLHVWGLYGVGQSPRDAPGCWVIGIQQLDEDVPLPDWRMRWYSAGYSPILEIYAPADAIVTEVR